MLSVLSVLSRLPHPLLSRWLFSQPPSGVLLPSLVFLGAALHAAQPATPERISSARCRLEAYGPMRHFHSRDYCSERALEAEAEEEQREELSLLLHETSLELAAALQCAAHAAPRTQP
jgi:hypothetical protein